MPDEISSSGGRGTGFTAKVKIKRKSLPSRPITVKIHASQEEASQGGAFGSSNPTSADAAAFRFPSAPKPKMPKGVKTPSGRKGSYK